MIRLATLVCALTLVTALPARADEVRLKNGDRLTGTTVSLTGGTLTFNARGIDLKIPWAEVTSLSLDTGMFVTVGTAAPFFTAFDAADAAGNVVLMPGGSVALADIVALTPRQSAWAINGGAGVGVVASSGNTQIDTIRLSGDIVAKGASDRYTASAVQARADDHGVDTARNWSVVGKYDRFLTSRLYANANAGFTNDVFRDIDLRRALGVGLGYQVINNARTQLTADGGVAWVNQNFKTNPDDSYTAGHESVSVQVQVVPGRMQVFHMHDGYFDVSGSNKMFIRTQSGGRLGIGGGFVTTAQWDVDYDRKPAPGRRQIDLTFSLTLGYRF